MTTLDDLTEDDLMNLDDLVEGTVQLLWDTRGDPTNIHELRILLRETVESNDDIFEPCSPVTDFIVEEAIKRITEAFAETK